MGRDRWRLDGDAPIQVERDAHGVPHVLASTEPDLYRGLGHCHATDRALQMLVVRILGRGRSAEVLDTSDEAVQLDIFFRRLNLAAGAADEYDRLSGAHRRLIDAYCAGVNAALARRLPWELRLFGYRPEPWTAADSVLVSRVIGYVALAQSQGDMERLLVEMVKAGVPRAYLDELFPDQLHDLDVELLRRVTLGTRLVPDAVRWNPALPRALASNNWALAGRKTATGHPLLANDPHLEVNRLPAVWYEVVLELGPRFCIAATMPGLPAMLLARTNDLAWGATYTFMDAIDSWVEDCRDGTFRRTENGRDSWHPFTVRTEVIHRKRKPSVTLTVHENEHGVVEGDPGSPGLYLATRWASATRTGSTSTAAMLGMLHAPDVARGMELVGRIETAWNWVLADRHGSIGYQMSGCMPLRAPGRNGLVPLAGWDPANDWRGLVPPQDLPRALNPEAGFLVTANQDLNHLGRARPINVPMGAYRAERIAELLAARDDWDVAATQRLQLDVFSPQAARFLAILRPLLPDTEAGRTLRDWDCRYDLASTGAPLFERFYRGLVVDVFGAVCGPDVLRFLVEETNVLADFFANFDGVLLRPASRWYGERGRDTVWREVAARAVVAPLETWGERQRIVMRHLVLGGRLPRWLGFDRGPVALAGGRATVQQGQVYRAGGRTTTFAPSYRLVTDLGEAAAHTTLAGGPSDRRFSPWYASDLVAWLTGTGKRLSPVAGSP